MAKVFLRHLNGSDPGKRTPIGQDRIVMGREETCDLVVESDFTSVSRKHAILRRKRQQWAIVDVGTEGTGSTYGTFVNGERLEPNEEHHVQPGDEIKLGGESGKFLLFSDNRTVFVPLQSKLVVDADKHEVLLHGRPLPIHLSPQEFDLMRGLWERQRGVCTLADICNILWPDEEDHSGRQADVHQVVRHVRKKLNPVVGSDVIENIPRVGYRLRA